MRWFEGDRRPATSPRRVRRSRWSYLAAGGVLGAVLLSAAREPTSDQPYTEAIEPLIAALGPYRFIEPRLTGGFEPAPCAEPGPLPPAEDDLVPEPDCAGGKAPKPRDLARALRDLEAARADLEPLSAARVAMLTELVGGRTTDGLRRATDHLEREAKHAGSAARADVWSDLAAAWLVLAQRANEPIELLNALHAADEALGRDDRHSDARFNRALVLDYLRLAEPARRAWDAFRDLDDGSIWAAEAEARQARIEAELAETARHAQRGKRLERAALEGDAEAAVELGRLDPSRARELVERQVLPTWGRSGLSGDQGAAGRTLAVARQVAVLLRDAGHDQLLADAIGSIDAAASDPERLAALWRGHRDFGEGMALYEGRKPAAAKRVFKSAWQSLSEVRSAFAGWPLLYLEICEYHGSRPGAATMALEDLVGRLDAGRSPALAGRILWQLALIDGVRGDRARGIKRLERAASVLASAADPTARTAIEDLLASFYDLLGDLPRSWRHRYLALHGLPHVTEHRRRWVIVSTTAESLLKRGEARQALAVFSELVRLSGRIPESQAQARLRRAEVFVRLGEIELALNDQQQAEAALEQIADVDLRTRIGVDLLVSRARAVAIGDQRAALRLLDEAQRFYGRAEHEFHLARVLLARARVNLALGRSDEAERDLDDALARAERQWQEIGDAKLKTAFIGEIQDLFDELILVRADDPAAAFTTTERARSRVLLTRISAAPLSADQVRAAVGPGTVLVEYALVRDRLLVWTLTNADLRLVTLDWSARGGSELLTGLGAAVAAGDNDAFHQVLTALYDLLLGSVRDSLAEGSSIVFVPHGPLAAIPFAALRDATTGRYLIEDHLVVVAPSASLHVAAQRRARALGSQPVRSLLAISDPAFDRRWHVDLPPLPGTRREIAALVELYGSEAVVLEGKQATPEAVAAAAVGRDVLHFAAHASVHAAEPERSKLVLASNGDEPSSGDLMPAAIERLPLDNARLVVLAVCGAAAGPATPGEGTLSLARSFLAAGTPAVVASLWDVDDDVAHHFFGRFHGLLRQGENPALALRATQLEMLSSSDVSSRSPRAWSGFQILGAVSALKSTEVPDSDD